MIRYTCSGSVCGGCGVKHTSLETAAKCCARHHDAIVRRNGRNAYSDRNPVHVDGSALSDLELEELNHIQDTLQGLA